MTAMTLETNNLGKPLPRARRSAPAVAADLANRLRAEAGVLRSIARVSSAPVLRRPDTDTLSDAIPVFFIGRNKDGFWVACDELKTTGGAFLFRTSAVRFAERAAAPMRCALIFPSERFELDTVNCGNPLLGLATMARRLWRLHVLAPLGGRHRAKSST